MTTMDGLRVFAVRLRALFRRSQADRQFDEEMQEHLELLTERFVSRGMSRQDAAMAARRQFGNTTLLQQRQREAQTFLSVPNLWRDVGFGVRMLRKNPGSTASVVIALALGIGMNTAIFTFVNALLLRPPARVASTGALLEIWVHNRAASGMQSYMPLTYSDYAYYRDHSRSLEGVLGFDGDGSEAIWNRSGAGQLVQGQLVSGNYFSVAGVEAALGRTIASGDDELDAPHPVIVVSYSFWQRQLGGDPAAVGRTLELNGTDFTVIGVAPQGFAGLVVATTPDFWAPVSLQARFTHDEHRLTNRHSSWLIVVGRMRPGVRKAAVQAEMRVLARQLELDHPESNKNQEAVVYPAMLVPGPFRGYVTAFTGLLLAVFGLVLLIACTNAASLMLARATGRAREMAIRSALGAGRAQLIRQMLIESLLLSSIAGAAAVGLAWWAARLLLELKPSSLPVTLEVSLDWRVLLFTVLVSLATGVVFGIIPALRSAGVNVAPTLKEETQTAGLRKSRLRSLLLVGEMAACVVLLTGATLCVRSLLHANSIDPGFDTQHIALATLDPSAPGYSSEKIASFYRRFLEGVRALPNVTEASYVDYLPLGTAEEGIFVGKHPGKDPGQVGVDVFRVAPGYFSTMGITLLRGRDFTQMESDSEAAGAVVINETLARELWPGEDAVGKRIALEGEKATSEVIGVVRAGKYRTLGEAPVPVLFRGNLPSLRTVVIRTPGDARPLLDEVRSEVQVVDPVMAATKLQTIGQYMALPLFPARATGLLLGGSGVLALVLTTIGLFGVISYVVSQRTHEIGVRIAMGARQRDVMKLVLRQGLLLTTAGVGVGLGVALAATRLLSSLLYGIRPDDPATLIGVSVGLAVVAVLACSIPAIRAMRIDPVTALRYE